MTNNNFVELSDMDVYNTYYSWLCELIGVNRHRQSYWLLADTLYKKRFFWTVPNDDNRAFEGKKLRERFCDEKGILFIAEQFNDTASMLELLIGLSYRCESIMADQEYSMPMHEWFWQILSNVGLDEYTDDAFDIINGNTAIDDINNILDNVINRTYRRNGKGGLFPLRHCKKDQRRVELWYQMSSYLVENYYEAV